jgi:general secretion pathway protein D
VIRRVNTAFLVLRLLLVVIMVCVAAPRAIAQPPAEEVFEDAPSTTNGNGWLINLDGVGFGEFVQQVSEITGETYVVDPNINTKVTVVSSTELSKEAVHELFLNVLRANGLTLARTGDIMLITQKPGSLNSNVIGADAEETDRGMVTQLVVLKNAKAQPIVQSLVPLLSETGSIQPAYYVNGLIITDFAANIDRINSLISQLDSRGGEEQEVIPLEYVWVGNVITVLQQAFLQEIQDEDPASIPLKIVADENNNAVFVSGTKSARERVKKAISLFDRKARQNLQTKVVYLSHTSAVEIVEILKNIITNINEAQEGVILASVQAEPETNSIILRANPTLTEELQDVISRLDIRRPQVHIEAAIVEVTEDLIDELGVQYAIGDAASGAFDVGTTSFTNIGQALVSVMSAVRARPELGASQINGVSLGTSNEGDFAVLLQALASTSNANLLSTPSITTLDNKEATIVVGQNVPFRTGTFTNDAGAVNPFTTIERRDVGIQLTVLPRIHEGNVVRMEIKQEVSSVVEDAVSSASDIITNTRSINTTILADNNETVVLGGLIQDDIVESEQKVPVLGDIPYLGRLFKSTSENYVKRNLLVFLRPTILRDNAAIGTVSDKKYNNFLDVNSATSGEPRGKQIYGAEDYETLYNGKLRYNEQGKLPEPSLRGAFSDTRKTINGGYVAEDFTDEKMQLRSGSYDPDAGKLRKLINQSLEQQYGVLPDAPISSYPNDAIRLPKGKATALPILRPSARKNGVDVTDAITGDSVIRHNMYDPYDETELDDPASSYYQQQPLQVRPMPEPMAEPMRAPIPSAMSEPIQELPRKAVPQSIPNMSARPIPDNTPRRPIP